MLRRVRRVVQALCLSVFLLLLLLTRYDGQDEIAYPVRLFLDIDPLVLLGTLLSAHAAPVAFFASLVVLASPLVVGRAFCAWVCPLGALNQLAGRLVRRRPHQLRVVHAHHRGQVAKYGVLAGLLVAAALGLPWVGLLDPISLTIRSVALALGPAAETATRAGFDALYHTGLDPILAVSEPVYDLAKRTVLSYEQPAFRQAALIGGLALAVLAANLVLPRFWCRWLCPLGALLGVVARYGALRLRSTRECDGCRRCTFRCPGAAAPDQTAAGGWRPSECFVCGNCTDTCEGLSFAATRPRALAAQPVRGVEISRRTALTAVAVGAVAVPLVRVPPSRRLPSPTLLRPPGSLPERDFLARCVRCGECMKVCLTGGLQPAALEAGLEGLWTPVLVPRIGYCEHACTLCGQVCPTGAIAELPVADKQRVRIGTAFLDPGRCIPLALGIDCIVCEEHCPTSPKAIARVEVDVPTAASTMARVGRPVIDPERCIGCGICENMCPVRDLPAIRVTSTGEDRDPANALLLDGGDPYGG